MVRTLETVPIRFPDGSFAIGPVRIEDVGDERKGSASLQDDTGVSKTRNLYKCKYTAINNLL